MQRLAQDMPHNYLNSRMPKVDRVGVHSHIGEAASKESRELGQRAWKDSIHVEREDKDSTESQVHQSKAHGEDEVAKQRFEQARPEEQCRKNYQRYDVPRRLEPVRKEIRPKVVNITKKNTKKQRIYP